MALSAVLSAVVAAGVVVAARGDPTQCLNGPCGPGNDQCGEPFAAAPQFHIMDKSCAENDPNGPVYDPVHGVYHAFYQVRVEQLERLLGRGCRTGDVAASSRHPGRRLRLCMRGRLTLVPPRAQDHLAEPQGGHGRGPDWGHAVSRDFVHWAHLPVAIWNDQPYDNVAIYTGSASIVNGKVVIVYPGLCSGDGCPGATNLCIAVPEDESDPLYTNWSKTWAQNPVVVGTQRDPSTAWQTAAGEWRLTTYDTSLYGSTDFKTWYTIGKQANFTQGECPSFFPLPSATPGTRTAKGAGTLPTHVHKYSAGGQDWMKVGTWSDGAVNTTGSWTQTPGYSFEGVLIDAGDFYASKDFYDPVKKRRINWGWARVPPASTQTLPRVLTWDDEIKQLVFSPAEELEQLRGALLASTSNSQLAAGGNMWLGDWADSAGNQSEIVVTFDRPSAAANFGVDVMVGPGSGGSNSSTRIFVNYVPGVDSVLVGVGAGTVPMLKSYMNHTDLPGGDFNVTNVSYKDPKICQAVCMANEQCDAWTYVVRPPLYASCCQKGASGWSYNPHNDACTSGVRTPGPAPGGAGKTAELALKESDTEITIRVFVDNTFVEAYWMEGRVAITASLANPPNAQAGVNVFNDGGAAVTASSAKAWHVDGIWVSPEEVLATPRLDGATRPEQSH